jgi:hypothetical protein
MPNWEKSEARPEKNCIIPFEVYSEGILSMREVMTALHELERKGLIEAFLKGSTFWYKIKK